MTQRPPPSVQKLKFLFAGVALGLMLSCPSIAAPIRVSGAVDQSEVQTMARASAYLTLSNDGKQDDRLLSITCSWCGAVEIHALKVDGKRKTMQLMPYGVKLPAGQSVSLSPTSAHVMLIGPKVPLELGRTVSITLHFYRAGAIRASLPVTNICRPQVAPQPRQSNVR